MMRPMLSLIATKSDSSIMMYTMMGKSFQPNTVPKNLAKLYPAAQDNKSPITLTLESPLYSLEVPVKRNPQMIHGNFPTRSGSEPEFSLNRATTRSEFSPISKLSAAKSVAKSPTPTPILKFLLPSKVLLVSFLDDQVSPSRKPKR